ncbi:MAG: histidine kinase N-terminal 7TM domain-containing protein [Halobacteriaceae archaeon]
MAWTPSALALVAVAGGAVALGVGAAALRERPDPMAWPLAVFMFAVAVWAIPHGVSFGFTDLESVVFWHRVQYPGTVAAPVAYLVLAVKYADRGEWLSPRVYAGLAVVPAVTVAVVWTNPSGLFWESLSLARVGGASVLVEEHGAWYWVNLGYLYLVTVAGLALFASTVLQSGAVYWKQSVAMFTGGVVPLAANVAAVAGAVPQPSLNPTIPSLAVTGVTFALALFHFDMLDIRPVARDRLVEELDDGVVVVGPEGRIRDFNPAAERVLDGLAVDRSAEAVLPDATPDGGELVAETPEGERLFRTRSTALTDERGRPAGRVVHLDDVTDLVERDQRITVLNRVLRHNVRNELTVALGSLDGVEDPDEHVERAAASVRRVNELAEKARTVERTLRAPDPEATPAGEVAEQVVADARDAYPGATVEYDGPSGPAMASVAGEQLFEQALAELVENGIEHNDADAPRVTVGVERADDRVRVRVADDGPGIPEGEREVLARELETQLEHGSGIGLWLVRWVASLSSGELSFGDNDPRGSVVRLEFPADSG